MQNISLKPLKAQEVNVTLNGQATTLRIVQRSTGMFMDIGVNNTWIAQGVICLNGNKIVRYPHLKFSGDLVFADTKGALDPSYDELGTRFKLFYLTAEEVEQ